NAAVVDRLQEGCISVLSQYQVAYRVVTVPGAFEVPFGVKSYWDTLPPGVPRPDVFIALACVVRGGTPHFDYVCKGITDGIVQLNLTLPVPTVFGVLTVDNNAQAEERLGGKHGHKGEEAAITALKMIALKTSIHTIY
ncbi:MAG TPA: 6,7-dimethyl-8-ribityllumazine synthase, partial [Agriterribacter sp.]|nr:6,7-dimethyl-8-ribityllumazine synthase [Agriterribacter sp.]